MKNHILLIKPLLFLLLICNDIITTAKRHLREKPLRFAVTNESLDIYNIHFMHCPMIALMNSNKDDLKKGIEQTRYYSQLLYSSFDRVSFGDPEPEEIVTRPRRKLKYRKYYITNRRFLYIKTRNPVTFFDAAPNMPIFAKYVSSEQNLNARSSTDMITEGKVGEAVNFILDKYCPDNMPVLRVNKTERSFIQGYNFSRYIGFVRTHDFFFANDTLLESVDPKNPVNHTIDNINSVRADHIVLTELIGGTPSFLRVCGLKTGEGNQDYKPVQFGLLTGLLIQLLSTLFYGAEIFFAHNDLLLQNILLELAPDNITSGGQQWVFDFVPIVENNIDEIQREYWGIPEHLRIRPYRHFVLDRVTKEFFIKLKKCICIPSRSSDERWLTVLAKARYEESDEEDAKLKSRKVPKKRERVIKESEKVKLRANLKSHPLTVRQWEQLLNEGYGIEMDLPDYERSLEFNMKGPQELLRFTVPNALCGKVLLRIIDLETSRAHYHGKLWVRDKDRDKGYNPFVDVIHFTVSILQVFPRNHGLTFTDEVFLSNTLRRMFGWQFQSPILKQDFLKFVPSMETIGVKWIYEFQKALVSERNTHFAGLVQTWALMEPLVNLGRSDIEIAKIFQRWIHHILSGEMFRFYLTDTLRLTEAPPHPEMPTRPIKPYQTFKEPLRNEIY